MSDERTLDELLRIADRAAAAIARVYTTDFAVEYKAAHDPVTIADREANGIIVEELTKVFPGVPVVAEESDPSTYAQWRDSDAVFFVDPLDGTRDFVKKNGEFAVMIGLAENGRAKLGAIHAPATGRRFGGGVNVPTFELDAAGAKTPVRVSSVKELREASLVLSRSRPSEDLVRIAGELGVKSVAPLGSAGIKALAVATAAAEIYSHLGQAGWRWDACAPEAIVLGAGGRTSDARGDAIDYRAESLENKSGIVMTNGHLHDAMIKAIDDAVRA